VMPTCVRAPTRSVTPRPSFVSVARSSVNPNTTGPAPGPLKPPPPPHCAVGFVGGSPPQATVMSDAPTSTQRKESTRRRDCDYRARSNIVMRKGVPNTIAGWRVPSYLAGLVAILTTLPVGFFGDACSTTTRTCDLLVRSRPVSHNRSRQCCGKRLCHAGMPRG
jgi:hypothetical protein